MRLRFWVVDEGGRRRRRSLDWWGGKRSVRVGMRRGKDGGGELQSAVELICRHFVWL